MTQAPQPFRTASPRAAIWILEPDPSLGQAFEQHCRDAGWRATRFASTAAFEMALAEDTPDLLLLNRSLTEHSGLQELQQLRQGGHHFAILMLAGPSSPAARAQGLELGADDYLSTPFLQRELMLRIEHLLNCSRGQVMAQVPMGHGYQLGKVHFDPDNRLLVGPQGQSQSLSRGDVVLLLALCRAPGAALNRAFLARTSGSLVDANHSRSLDVRISKLRRLLSLVGSGDALIACVRGQGYRLTVPAVPAASHGQTTPMQAPRSP